MSKAVPCRWCGAPSYPVQWGMEEEGVVQCSGCYGLWISCIDTQPEEVPA